MGRIYAIGLGLAVLVAGYARGDDDVQIVITGKVYVRADKTGTEDNAFEIVVGDKRVYPLVVNSLELRRQLAGHMIAAARRDRKAWDTSRVKVTGGLDESGAVVVTACAIDGTPAVAKAPAGKGQTGNQLAGKLVNVDDDLGIEKSGKKIRLGFGKDKAALDFELELRAKIGQQVTLTGQYGRLGDEEIFGVAPPKK